MRLLLKSAPLLILVGWLCAQTGDVVDSMSKPASHAISRIERITRAVEMMAITEMEEIK